MQHHRITAYSKFFNFLNIEPLQKRFEDSVCLAVYQGIELSCLAFFCRCDTAHYIGAKDPLII
jgi:hypothetical protein